MPEDTLHADDVKMDALANDDDTDQSNNENSVDDDLEDVADEEEDRVFYDDLGDWFVGNVT